MDDVRRARPWHSLETNDTLTALGSSAQGLTTADAARRLSQYGPNRLPEASRPSTLKRLLAQFNNLLIYVLIGSALLSLLLAHYVDASVILLVVLVNAIIGFIQEGRAERALEAIRALIDPKAAVLRDGRRVSIPADQVVPGDIVLLEAGDRIPADIRLLRASNLKVEEAILTGESVAVDKAVDGIAADAPVGDRSSMAFSGTFVAAGRGSGVAVGTGADTELGRISILLGTVETLKTPLTRQMDAFARQLSVVVLAIAGATFLFAHYMRDYAVDDAFMVVVGVAVSAIPEGLPAILTITLAIGVQRMAARDAIIRRLPAVETLGSVSVICTDKTGTLTRNEMTVRSLDTAHESVEVTGVGYAPEGGFRDSSGKEVDPATDVLLLEILRAGLLCNDAQLRQTGSGWVSDGDPMEGALVSAAVKAGLEPTLVRKQLPRTDEIPFDAQHRYMATLHHSHEGGAFMLVKGAPERIIEMCSAERTASGDVSIHPQEWHERANALAGRGERVLGLATKPAQPGQQDMTSSDVTGGAVLLGLVGFIDPPREEAVQAIQECKFAKIRVVMITGDHAVTAREIARQLGVADEPRVVEGQTLEALDDRALTEIARDTPVFARTTPQHKLRLVEALQANGLIVAMTGDGVNDAPALKRADIGVAMGQKGTETAKEAADLVLADDNFASIVAAVREGRTIYDNIMKVIGWTLPTNGGEALTIMAAIALGLTLPITPVQILWVNMITAVALGLTLAFEPPEPGVMRRAPRRGNQPILSADLIWRIGFISTLFVVGAFGIFYWAGAEGLTVEQARTLVVNAFVVMEIFYLFSVRYVHRTSLTWQGVLGTPAVVGGVALITVAQLAFTYIPFMNSIFETQPVGMRQGLAVIGIGVALLVIAEIEKRLRRAITDYRRGNRTYQDLSTRNSRPS